MKKTIKTFMIRSYPGPMYIETSTCEVRGEKSAHTTALRDTKCFGYELFRTESTEINGKTYESKPEFFKAVIFGNVYTIKEIERMEHMGDLVDNMKSNGLDRFVKTRCGNWQPWSKYVEYISE